MLYPRGLRHICRRLWSSTVKYLFCIGTTQNITKILKIICLFFVGLFMTSVSHGFISFSFEKYSPQFGHCKHSNRKDNLVATKCFCQICLKGNAMVMSSVLTGNIFYSPVIFISLQNPLVGGVQSPWLWLYRTVIVLTN